MSLLLWLQSTLHVLPCARRQTDKVACLTLFGISSARAIVLPGVSPEPPTLSPGRVSNSVHRQPITLLSPTRNAFIGTVCRACGSRLGIVYFDQSSPRTMVKSPVSCSLRIFRVLLRNLSSRSLFTLLRTDPSSTIESESVFVYIRA
jgi:hypothetical protein